MRKQVTDSSVKLWLSANDTYDWANRPGNRWPCSQLANHRLFAEFDRNGLVDIAIDGKDGDCDAHELNAIVSDHLRPHIPESHPLWSVCIQSVPA